MISLSLSLSESDRALGHPSAQAWVCTSMGVHKHGCAQLCTQLCTCVHKHWGRLGDIMHKCAHVCTSIVKWGMFVHTCAQARWSWKRLVHSDVHNNRAVLCKVVYTSVLMCAEVKGRSRMLCNAQLCKQFLSPGPA